MRILLIHTYYKQRGGEDVVFEAEIKRLTESGVIIKSLIFNNSKTTLLNLAFQHFNPFSYHRTKKIIRNFKPDIIHVHNLHFAASPSIIWAAHNSKIPIVVTLHNFRLLCPSAILYHNGLLFLDSLNGRFAWNAIRNKVYRNSSILTFWIAITISFNKFIGTWKKVNVFITLTEFARNIFLNSNLGLLKSQIVVKSNFIEDFKIENSYKKKGFAFIGRLSAEKGIDILIKAFAELPFNLTIIGDGPLRKQIEELVRLNKNISYLGFQNKDVIQSVLKNSSALLFPSICYEGMPMTILESLANGTPVIANSLGSIPYIITDNTDGFLFKSNDCNDLIAKINNWVQMNEQDKNIFYKNSRESYLKKFSSNINDAAISAIYNHVLRTPDLAKL